jgi:hypothetical protein
MLMQLVQLLMESMPQLMELMEFRMMSSFQQWKNKKALIKKWMSTMLKF